MNAMTKAPLQGEVLSPSSMVCVIAAMHPMKPDHELVFVPVGASIDEIVATCERQCGFSRLAEGAYVEISGHEIRKEVWHLVRVRENAHVVVRATAGKGAGGILKSILSIALTIVASFIVGPAGLALSGPLAGIVSGAIIFGGGLLLNALFPPASTSSDETTKTVYSISASRNGVAKWGPIPVLLGRTRIAPKYAAIPYTEFVGDDQYLRMLFVWGQGPIDIGEIKIGETLLSQYADVEVQNFSGYATDGQQTLYPAEVIQDDLSIEITLADGPSTRTTAEDAAEIVVDLVAPNGLFNVDTKKGRKEAYTVTGVIEVFDAGTANMVVAEGFIITAASADPIRRSYRFAPMQGGQYDVRVRRTSPDDEGADDKATQVVWTALKTFRASPPIEYSKPLAITALRIRATKQLNGAIDDLNAVCTSRGKIWTGSIWLDDQPTQNPADLYRLILQGPGIARPWSDASLDLDTIQLWHEMCTAKGWKFNMLRDFDSTVPETLRDVCAAGRAVPTFRDGKWSVAWEEDLAPIVQHFTPRNSSDFTWGQVYRDLPHALRVKFVNERKGYIEDERLVYDDGYSKANADFFEQAEFPGVTDPDLIYKHGRYRIADARLRPATYTLMSDFEHLVCTRGDRVRVAHDVIKRGLSQGRVKSVAGNIVTLDEPILITAGNTFGLRYRRADMTSAVCTITTAPGEVDVVTVTGTPPSAGDLFMFGILGQESSVYRIMGIRPGADLSAEITLVDDAPGIQVADTGPIFGEPGVVVIPAPATAYYPRNLAVSSVLENREGAAVYVTQLYWSVITGPTYVSFEIVATDPQGNERIKTAPGSASSVEYVNLAIGIWAFRVRAFLLGGGATDFSPPLTVLVETPEDRLGVGLLNIQADLDSVLKYAGEQFSTLKANMEALSANTFLTMGQNKLDVREIGIRLVDETTIRVAQNAVMGKRVTGIEAKLGIAEEGIAALASATQTLETRITFNEDGLASFSEVTTTALARIDTLNAEQGTAISAQGGAISTLQSDVTAQGEEIEINAQAVLGALARLDGVDAVNSAQASSILTLASNITAQGSTISAQASAILGVSAELQGAFASGLLSFQVVAAPAGVSARAALIIRAAVGQAWQQTGTYWDILPGGGTRIVNIADRFIVTDGSSDIAPFIISGGVVRLNVAYFNVLQSLNEKLYIDGILGRIIIRGD